MAFDLRKEARGRDCQVRLLGICNFNPETAVLAHYRMAGLSGVGRNQMIYLGRGAVQLVMMKSTAVQCGWAMTLCV